MFRSGVVVVDWQPWSMDTTVRFVMCIEAECLQCRNRILNLGHPCHCTVRNFAPLLEELTMT